MLYLLAMATLISTLLLAGSASAQYTTSFWQPVNGVLPDKIGFVGSVEGVAADGNPIVSMDFDKGVDTEGLGLDGYEGTLTIGPKTIGYNYGERWGDNGCTKPNTDENTIICSATYPGDFVRAISCGNGRSDQMTTSYEYITFTHSYPARLTYESGIETVTQTRGFEPDPTSTPGWCNDDNFTPSPMPSTITMTGTELVTVQLVITAGLGKLNISTTATAPVLVVPSSSTGSPSNSAELPQETNAAARMGTEAPMVAGFAAAAAALLL